MGRIRIRVAHSRQVSRILVWLPASLIVLISYPTEISGSANIRLQVNNDNLQNPPYLLEALKQAEKADGKLEVAAAASQKNDGREATIGATGEQPMAALSVGVVNNPALDDAGARPTETGQGSVAEILGLSSGSVLKLLPGTMAGSASFESSQLLPDAGLSPTDRKDEIKQSRPFQLDVTGSHLKRPAKPSSALAEEEIPAESAPLAALIKQQPATQAPTSNSKPKSLVVLTIANDDAGAGSKPAASQLKEKIAVPQDTWEPSQVMQGVTNASLVPATVKRHYGHQTRTRITLGGGYQRDQDQDPPASAGSNVYAENKPEKPKAPLEKPQKEQQASSAPIENSRVIEVPERIVLPVSVFTKETATNESETIDTPEVGRKRDKRCPSNGVTSLEHPTACDKYFLCEDGYMSEQVCPNGLMYGTRDIVRDFCVHRWQAVCGDKSVPNPISSPGCRWQNGIFNVQGSPKCTPDFYECTDGAFQVKKCTISGQVYDDKTKSCQYAEQVDCTQEALSDFQCPTDDQSNTYWPFPRYFLNERALIHCINDKPQIIRCRDHERVDPQHLFCVPLDKSAHVNEDGSTDQTSVSTRRATAAQREKGKKAKKEQNNN